MRKCVDAYVLSIPYNIECTLYSVHICSDTSYIKKNIIPPLILFSKSVQFSVPILEDPWTPKLPTKPTSVPSSLRPPVKILRLTARSKLENNTVGRCGPNFSGRCEICVFRFKIRVMRACRCENVKIRNLLLRSRPSGHCEIVWVLSDGLSAAIPARRPAGFFHLW